VYCVSGCQCCCCWHWLHAGGLQLLLLQPRKVHILEPLLLLEGVLLQQLSRQNRLRLLLLLLARLLLLWPCDLLCSLIPVLSF
jgi:hypothetical protein